MTIEVVPGKDAAFDLYEDDGITYDCEQGKYSIVPIRWNEQARSLTIGKRTGGFDGMKQSRRFVIKVIDGTNEATKEVDYQGEAVTVSQL